LRMVGLALLMPTDSCTVVTNQGQAEIVILKQR
jgi:hypothetical protein